MPTTPSIPVYSLLLHVYYRIVTDKEGQDEFARAIPPFGGLGSDYWDVVFKEKLLSPEVIVDWSALLGVKNRGVVDLMLDKIEEKRPSFHDEMIGFFVNAGKKLEEMAKRLLDKNEKDPRESEYVAFISDIISNFMMILQCVPRTVYCMFDSVQSLLYHSDLKHILIASYAACKDYPEVQNSGFCGDS